MNSSALDFNYSCPEIPDEIMPTQSLREMIYFSDECEALWKEIIIEVTDPDYVRRSHHNAGTYDAGCRGPLCRKSYREHPKRKLPMDVGRMTPREERIFDPIMEYFHTVMKHRVKQHQLLVRGA